MAPSPENDNAPKAPDKNEKTKCGKQTLPENCKEKDKDDKSLSNLNDGELKALLDEAMTYKNPKDREGKSKLFKVLLSEAEESERIARAASAGGSELVRHCNPSARRNGRHRRKPSSISENMMHGGSLDNLAKEELYDADRHLHRTRKSVSARQREGGSLPCNVNSSVLATYDYYFLEEARKKQTETIKPEHTAIDMESESLLKHDYSAQNYQDETAPIELVTNPTKYTSKATLQVNANNDSVQPMTELDGERKPYEDTFQTKLSQSKHKVIIPISNNRILVDDKKVDENGNALHQNPGTKTKKKKVHNDKNVVVLQAKDVQGHRGDIIDDIPKLIQFIGGNTDGTSSGKSRSNVHKSKQMHKQETSEESGRSKKQRAQTSKGKENRSELKKSNSLGEISTTKLDEFSFSANEESDKILRSNKPLSGERPRERRSWGTVEAPMFHASAETLETLEWELTKPKKKSKKRRSSVSSSRQPNSGSESNSKNIQNRARSPDLRGKSTSSVPHSERSNDSSDVDSVHSLPIDGSNTPISYADIAKNSEKTKEKKLSPEKFEKVPNKDKSPTVVAVKSVEIETSPPKIETAKPKVAIVIATPAAAAASTAVVNNLVAVQPIVQTNQLIVGADKQIPVIVNNVASSSSATASLSVVNNNVKNLPPDVHNIKNFPAISNNNKVHNISNLQQVNVNKANNNKNNHFVSNKVKNNSTNNKSVKNNVQKVNSVLQNSVTIDIQTDLSIIQANEKDSIQFNAQMLPPDIPDVQTIEKMQFMCSEARQMDQQQQMQQQQQLVHNHRHQYHILQQRLHSPHHSQLSPTSPHAQQQQQHLPVLNSYQIAVSPTTPTKISSGASSQSSQSMIVVDNNTNSANNCDNNDRTTNLNERPPPVVILSGMGNKDVSGLVFGFDINEELLSEDICQNFIDRYRAPEVFNQGSHNHDKIVNFIGTAWDAVVNQPNGNVQYYSDGL